jgi:hypothetical protein
MDRRAGEPFSGNPTSSPFIGNGAAMASGQRSALERRATNRAIEKKSRAARIRLPIRKDRVDFSLAYLL